MVFIIKSHVRIIQQKVGKGKASRAIQQAHERGI
jgi:hypothetical protein